MLLKNMTHMEVIKFVQEYIIHQFGVPQTLTTDQGASFMSQQFREFARSLRIKFLNSSPYYAQPNGQAEASNKSLIQLIKKKVDEKSKRWLEVLSEALWAHRTALHGIIKVTPFKLVYGREAMLPVEINLQTHRVVGQDRLSAMEYAELMMGKVDEVPESIE
jgi:transposase InsO family protein